MGIDSAPTIAPTLGIGSPGQCIDETKPVWRPVDCMFSLRSPGVQRPSAPRGEASRRMRLAEPARAAPPLPPPPPRLEAIAARPNVGQKTRRRP